MTPPHTVNVSEQIATKTNRRLGGWYFGPPVMVKCQITPMSFDAAVRAAGDVGGELSRPHLLLVKNGWNEGTLAETALLFKRLAAVENLDSLTVYQVKTPPQMWTVGTVTNGFSVVVNQCQLDQLEGVA